MKHERLSPVTVKLITDCMCRKLIEQVISDQAVFLESEKMTVIMGVDGHMSVGCHPDNVVWENGTTDDLIGVSDIEIIRSDGNLVSSGHLNRNFVIRMTNRGVSFFIGPAA